MKLVHKSVIFSMILLILCGFMVNDAAMEGIYNFGSLFYNFLNQILVIRSKRQIDPQKMIPWMEMAAKYGKIAAETVVMPMAKEGMELAMKPQ